MIGRFIIIAALFLGSFMSLGQSVKEMLTRAEKLHNAYPDSAFSVCCTVEELTKKKDNEVDLAYAKLCKVRFYVLRNKLELSAEELEQANALFQKNNDLTGLAKTYTAMANIAGRIHKDADEIEYLEKANEIFRQLKDTSGMLKALTNLALNYIHIGNLNQGQNALKELEQFSQGMPEKEFYYLNQNWGILYERKGNYAAALRRFETAKNIAEKNQMIDSEATILYLMSGVFIAMDELGKAEKTIDESYHIAYTNHLVVEQMEALEMMNKIYEMKGETEKAYASFRKIVAIKDTIYNLEKINKLNDYEKKIALAEKQKIIASQNLDLEKSKMQLLKDKYEIYGLTGGLAVVLVSVGFLLVNIRHRKRAHLIISAQKEEVERQKQIVDEKNNQIMSSITYAKRIQEAILPQDKIVKEYLENSFIYYRAKDIVSGDFYWMRQPEGSKNEVLFAAVDCTGHGVPGAFMSIVGNNGLNKAVRELKLKKPSHILDSLNLHVISALQQQSNEIKDGMDIALCLLNLETRQLEFAGAYNPLFIIRSGSHSIEIINGDKQPIGDARDVYANHTIQLEKGDTVYVFTDGYSDQFGGKKDKKFGTKQFKELLLQIHFNSMEEQRNLLKNTFEEWMLQAGNEQIDDVCVMGVRI